jgi:hypothetical protein
VVPRQFYEVSSAAYDNHALDVTQPYNILGGVACALWTVAYIQIFRQAKRDQVYGVPLVAVCMNITWEAIYSFFAPDPSWLWLLLDRSWFVFDLLIGYQLLRYGRKNQVIPELGRHFYLVVAGTLLLALFGHLTFRMTFRDPLGLVSAYVINFVMSILFVFMALSRRSTKGMSWSGAWLKAVGSLGASVQCYFLIPLVNDALETQYFLYFLYLGIPLFDAIYIYLLWTYRKQERRGLRSLSSPSSPSSPSLHLPMPNQAPTQDRPNATGATARLNTSAT